MLTLVNKMLRVTISINKIILGGFAWFKIAKMQWMHTISFC